MKLLLVCILAVVALPLCLCGLQELKVERCKQSSQYDKTGDCQNAIDGNKDQIYKNGSCSHAGAEAAWWLGDTQKLARVKQIRIHNRQDCCADRLNDFVITVDGATCASYYSNVSFSVKTFDCDLVGTLVKIKSNRLYLTLCEVQVFGEPIANADSIRLNHCRQSSNFSPKNGHCTNAIDGRIDQVLNWNSCSHVGAENGWWSAKTHERRPALIKFVRIHNREDCCAERLNDFTISVDGKECASYRSRLPFSARTFKCDAVGTEVTITSKLPYLTLCEVEVFGEYDKPSTVQDVVNSTKAVIAAVKNNPKAAVAAVTAVANSTVASGVKDALTAVQSNSKAAAAVVNGAKAVFAAVKNNPKAVVAAVTAVANSTVANGVKAVIAAVKNNPKVAVATVANSTVANGVKDAVAAIANSSVVSGGTRKSENASI